MLKHELIISTDLGRESLFEIKAFRGVLRDLLHLRENLPIEVSILLGTRANEFMKQARELDEFDLHFRLPSHSLIEHGLDAILNSQFPCFLQSFQVPAPLVKWQKWITISEQLYNEDNTGFYRFHSSETDIFPYLIHSEGKAHLRTLFREGKTQNLRDFDWRRAKFVAESSFNKTDSLTQRA